MFTVRRVQGAVGAELMEPARGPMIRDRAIEIACELTGRDRERVAPFVEGLRRGEHVRIETAPEIAGLVGDVGPVRVDWIGPATFPEGIAAFSSPVDQDRARQLLDCADAPGLTAEGEAELRELQLRALRSPVTGEIPGSRIARAFSRTR